jgi:hypothetical protein
MNKETITKLQKQYGVHDLQLRINDGSIWSMEGTMGRSAMDALESGACYLGDKHTFDFWGNRIPAISEIEEGSKGSLQNSINYWDNVIEYDDIGI